MGRLIEYCWPLACQIGHYATLYLLDDPAMLALAFC
jgi:hypothetical protein